MTTAPKSTVPSERARDALERAAAARARLAAHPHRPRYHFQPPDNWMNDPNGFIQWNGTYHLFYQHNPGAAVWGDIHWGHASSRDLVHWRDEPIALRPNPDGPDAAGCFSGCAIDDDGTPTLVYTGFRNGEQTQCIATGTPDLERWTAHSANPVLAGAPTGMRASEFRDPFVWRDGETWYMVLASALEEGGGAALLYRSSDLVSWEYRGPLLTGDPASTGEIWECPNFFPLGDRYVLIVSVWPRLHVHYFVGTYENERFTPERDGKLDHDGAYYAPLSALDESGRRLMVGWLDEWCGKDAQHAAGWAGALSLPQVVTLADDGHLAVAPVPEVETLRGTRHRFDRLRVDGREELPVRSDAFELCVEFDTAEADGVGVALRVAPDGSEETRMVLTDGGRRLRIDRSRSSRTPEIECGDHGGDVRPTSGPRTTLRVFVDRSVIEIYVNERQHFVTRTYPTHPDARGIALLTDRETNVRVDVWELASIW